MNADWESAGTRLWVSARLAFGCGSPSGPPFGDEL
jgi:hypothetical protein